MRVTLEVLKMDKVDMYHSCRWCKHYKNGYCTNGNFYVYEKEDYVVDISDEVLLEIKEPESFYCKHWE